MTVAEVYATILLVGVVVLIFNFYWLRVGTIIAILVLWGGLVIGAPLALAAKALSDGSWSALLILAVCVPAGFFWLIGASAAYDWYEREQKLSTFWKPWNAR